MALLKNKLRRLRTFNLEAPYFVKRHGSTPYGRPEALTMLALEKKEVDDAVLACAEVRAAIADGSLRVLAAPTPKVEEAKPTVKPADAKPRRRSASDE